MHVESTTVRAASTRMRLWSAKPGDQVLIDGRWWTYKALAPESMDVILVDGGERRIIPRHRAYTLEVEVIEAEVDRWGYRVPAGDHRPRIFGRLAGGVA